MERFSSSLTILLFAACVGALPLDPFFSNETFAVKNCPACTCACSWAKPSTCNPPGDGSCCWNCCCSTTPPPSPPSPPAPPIPAGLREPAYAMIKRMGMGINLGNTLEAPDEGAWAPKAQQSFFQEYKARGFTNVRIPVQWNHHTATSPPYKVDDEWMERVAEVVGWSIAEGLVTVINTHHETWLDNQADFEAELPRETAIWTQIAARFKNHSTSLLCFEIFNEPHVMSMDQLNALYSSVLPIIRATNPTRITFIGGLSWYNPTWITSASDKLLIPNDDYLALQVHSYDPYGYTWKVPGHEINHWGSVTDIGAMNRWMDDLAAWSRSKRMPVYYSEFGCTHDQTKATGRITWYEQHRNASAAHGFAAAVWDDDAGYALFYRKPGEMYWDNDVLVALGKTPRP